MDGYSRICGIVALAVVAIGAIISAAVVTVQGREVPPGLIAIGAAAVGGLLGLTPPEPGKGK